MGLNPSQGIATAGSTFAGEKSDRNRAVSASEREQAIQVLVPSTDAESQPAIRNEGKADWLDNLVPHSADTYEVALRWALPALDLIIIMLAGAYAFETASSAQSSAPHTAAAWIVAGLIVGIYRLEFLRLSARRLTTLMGMWFLTVCSLWIVALATSAELSPQIWAKFGALGAIGVLLVRLSVWVFAGRIILSGSTSRQIVIVGETTVTPPAVDRILGQRPGATISAIIDPELTEHDVTAAHRALPVDEVVLFLHRNGRNCDPLNARLRQLPITVSLLEPGGNGTLIRLQSRPLSGSAQITKRAFDLVVSSVLLFFFAPLMLLLGVLIKCSDPGAPVFYLQRRHGFNQSTFVAYKFRTMRVEANSEREEQATVQDVRVTPLGRFLRASSIDELPQLLNVFAGDMSLVGPRPHPVWLNERFSRVLNGYLARHRVKPGITGLAQVNGLRGETDTVEKMKMRVEMDLRYIEQWSLWLDLSILLRTAGIIVKPGGAY
jgi:exopolysaccharide biosynthesis polyprenyl glycosylphosphotransferase